MLLYNYKKCEYYSHTKVFGKELIMDNNKNRMKDREKSNATLRKMEPRDNADVGIINGQKIGVHESKHERSKSEK
jgi:hypothetical protein